MNKKRDKNILALYKKGMTLEAIGDVFSLTKERVRQILSTFNNLKKRSYTLTEKSHNQRKENARKQHERLIPYGGRPKRSKGKN